MADLPTFGRPTMAMLIMMFVEVVLVMKFLFRVVILAVAGGGLRGHRTMMTRG